MLARKFAIILTLCVIYVWIYMGCAGIYTYIYTYTYIYMPIYTSVYIEQFKTYNITAEVRELAWKLADLRSNRAKNSERIFKIKYKHIYIIMYTCIIICRHYHINHILYICHINPQTCTITRYKQEYTQAHHISHDELWM